MRGLPRNFATPVAVALPSYRRHWVVIVALCLVVVWWTLWGAARARRRGLDAARVPEAART
ncbi:MAG: hypothetical protein HY925_00100, partial [Elusimicrobia bacterium]|nr:hypothetical protein [Elusimicrobiota bacterium]